MADMVQESTGDKIGRFMFDTPVSMWLFRSVASDSRSGLRRHLARTQ